MSYPKCMLHESQVVSFAMSSANSGIGYFNLVTAKPGTNGRTLSQTLTFNGDYYKNNHDDAIHADVGSGLICGFDSYAGQIGQSHSSLQINVPSWYLTYLLCLFIHPCLFSVFFASSLLQTSLGAMNRSEPLQPSFPSTH